MNKETEGYNKPSDYNNKEFGYDVRFALKHNHGRLSPKDIDSLLISNWIVGTHSAMKAAAHPYGKLVLPSLISDLAHRQVAATDEYSSETQKRNLTCFFEQRFSDTFSRWAHENTWGVSAKTVTDRAPHAPEYSLIARSGQRAWYQRCREAGRPIFEDGKTLVVADDVALLGLPEFMRMAIDSGGSVAVIFQSSVRQPSLSIVGAGIDFEYSTTPDNSEAACMPKLTLISRDNIPHPNDPKYSYIAGNTRRAPIEVLGAENTQVIDLSLSL